MSADLRFQSKGTLLEGSIYIEREADRQLVGALQNHEYCYVLGQRQIGKSSLRARTERKLQQLGFRTVSIDLTSIGREVTQEEWYYALSMETADQLDIINVAQTFWRETSQLPAVQRWLEFIRKIVVTSVQESLIIFFDEIEVTLKLPFNRDDFFSGLRSLFNFRTAEPSLERVTFCIMGSVAYRDLIHDSRQTPFNIGRHIDIGDFTEQEAQLFTVGLSKFGHHAQSLVWAVFNWTNGHPYMTQRLCEEIQKVINLNLAAIDIEKAVSEVVHSVFLEQGENDANLAYASRYLTQTSDKSQLLKMFDLYLKILRKPVRYTEKTEEISLWLSGVVSRRQNQQQTMLTIRNKIIASVFNQEWVRNIVFQNSFDKLNHALPWYSRSSSRLISTSIFLALIIASAPSAIKQINRVWQNVFPKIDPSLKYIPAPSGMVLITGDTFQMGSTSEEIEKSYQICIHLEKDNMACRREIFDRERPTRIVTISSFYIDQNEVTNAEYATWLNRIDGPREVSIRQDGRLVFKDGVTLLDLFAPNSGIFYENGRFIARAGAERKPVVQVSWHGASLYCLSQGKSLLSEAQWEFAARGKEGRTYPWGNALPECGKVALNKENKLSCRTTNDGPSDVGTSAMDKTPEGVNDLCGNVEEWVLDRYQILYPSCSPPCRNPVVADSIGQEPYAFRVVRGSSWSEGPTFCRGASRSRWNAISVATNLGFRCSVQAVVREP